MIFNYFSQLNEITSWVQPSERKDKFHFIATTETYNAYKGKCFNKYCIPLLFLSLIEKRGTCSLILFYSMRQWDYNWASPWPVISAMKSGQYTFPQLNAQYVDKTFRFVPAYYLPNYSCQIVLLWKELNMFPKERLEPHK